MVWSDLTHSSLSKPIAIVLFVSPPEALVHKFLPPIYIYVNDAFCELLRYPLVRLRHFQSTGV